MAQGKQSLPSIVDARFLGNVDDPGVFLVSKDPEFLAGLGEVTPSTVTTPTGPSTVSAHRLAGSAPEILRHVLGGPVTANVLLVADYVTAVIEAVEIGWVIPDSSANGVLFATPASPAIRTARRAVADADTFDRTITDDILLDLAWSVTERVIPDVRVTLTDDELADLKAWNRQLLLRMSAGGRLAIRLEPPRQLDGWWHMTPVLVSLDDENVAVAASDVEAAASTFEAEIEDLDALLSAEWRMARDIADCLGAAPFETSVSDEEVIWLLEVADELEAVGIDLLAPRELLGSARLRTVTTASGAPSSLQAAELTLKVDTEVIFDDGTTTTIDAVEVKRFSDAASRLISVGGRWVRLDADSTVKARAALDRARRKVAAAELLYDDDEVDLSDVEGWVGDALNGLPWPGIEPLDPDGGFTATLRPYQRDGLGWLRWLADVGMGGVLADDMGLGKTCQVLALIHADHPGPTLVVCPAVVVENWARESARFAPSLRVGTFHGASREAVSVLADSCDLVITTYDLLRRDASLREQPWHRAVLDEAQAIKNPGTKVAAAARQIVAPHRLALTGTPVENHLGDLWSIMQFVEPGLLGKRSSFNEIFVNPDPDPRALDALKRITRPVLLRRSKRDPGVADDLPDKIEIRVDCAMTPEQIGLYDATTESLLAGVDDADGIARRGQVLAALTRLKQICAHPWMITRDGALAGRSGKYERLVELLGQIVDGGDAAIVFTQFASLLEPMVGALETTLGRRVLAFSGKTSLVNRQRAVDEFSADNGPPIILISKLAGGKGINLVRANHVIHYDQWWNPAVEDQASDRAWRIGQLRTVEVHDMVCPGTLEDRIAALLVSKRALASTVTGLSGLVDLDTDALRELVVLGRAEIVEMGAM